MKNSARGSVDPFIVMDVMEAASKKEKSGYEVIHLEVGQPGTSAPKMAAESVTNKISKSTTVSYTHLTLPTIHRV